MQEEECSSVTQNTLHPDLNINSRGKKWEAVVSHAYGKETRLLSIQRKGLIIYSKLRKTTQAKPNTN